MTARRRICYGRTRNGSYDLAESAKAFDAPSKINGNITVRAIRNGKTIILEKENIAAGDILLLSAGDKIPAYFRLLESTALSVDESALTGENIPANKNAKLNIADEKMPLAERANMIYSDTFITDGNAKAIVTAVDNSTEFAFFAMRILNG